MSDWPLFILIWYSIDITAIAVSFEYGEYHPKIAFPPTFQSSKCLLGFLHADTVKLQSKAKKPIFKVDLNMSMRPTSYDAQQTLYPRIDSNLNMKLTDVDKVHNIDKLDTIAEYRKLTKKKYIKNLEIDESN